MLPLAQEKDLVVRLLHKPGAFVSPGVAVALVWPGASVDENLARHIRRAFQIGNVRTPMQDIEYAVNQLVEMAVRAMSPAINDPFTAMTCLDYLGKGLAQFGRQGERGSHYYDRAGRLRLVLEPLTFEGLLDASFDMLRHASCDNARVLLHMLAVLDVIDREAKSPAVHRALLRQTSLVEAESQIGNLIEQDRRAVCLNAEALRMKWQKDQPLLPTDAIDQAYKDE
jgi:uncharacterized membrane protein